MTTADHTEQDIPTMSRTEKRLLLAQMVRANILGCFDDSGSFDLARAQRVLPACVVQSLVIHETTRTDKAGNTTTQRRITLRLVDKIRVMRLDDLLEDREDALNYRRPLTRKEFEASRRRKMAEEQIRQQALNEDVDEDDPGPTADPAAGTSLPLLPSVQFSPQAPETATIADHPPLSPLPPVPSKSEFHVFSQADEDRERRLRLKAEDDAIRRDEAKRRAEELAARRRPPEPEFVPYVHPAYLQPPSTPRRNRRDSG